MTGTFGRNVFFFEEAFRVLPVGNGREKKYEIESLELPDAPCYGVQDGNAWPWPMAGVDDVAKCDFLLVLSFLCWVRFLFGGLGNDLGTGWK